MGYCPKGGPWGGVVVVLVQHCPKKGVGVGPAWHYANEVEGVGVAQPYPKGEFGWVLAQQDYLVQPLLDQQRQWAALVLNCLEASLMHGCHLTLAGPHQQHTCPDSVLLLLDWHCE